MIIRDAPLSGPLRTQIKTGVDWGKREEEIERGREGGVVIPLPYIAHMFRKVLDLGNIIEHLLCRQHCTGTK